MSSEYVNQRIIDTIVPCYKFAYIALNHDIVQPLLAADTESDQATKKDLIDSLLHAAKMVRKQLHEATEASERLRITIDEQIAQLVLSISSQEKQVRDSQVAVNDANENVRSTQHQVDIIEAAVRDNQHSLNVANQAVHDAQQALNNARICNLGRHKRSFSRDILEELNPVKIVRNVIIKPVCSVVNISGINNASASRTLAEQNLHQTQQRLHTQQLNHIAHQRHRNSALLRLHDANIRLQATKSALEEQRGKQALVTSLATPIKEVEVHLNTVLDSSNVLPDELAQLIDFELVIKPLNNIYREMLTNNIIIPFGFQISVESARQISQKLKNLTDKMPLNGALETNLKKGDDFDIGDEEVIDAPNTDSDEANSEDTSDEEVNDAPKTDSDEAHSGDISDEEVTESPNTNSNEGHSDDTADGDVTNASNTDSDDAHSDDTADEEVTDASITDLDEAHNDDTVDREGYYDATLER